MITTAVMTKRKRSEHYVNNKEFLSALIKYREDVEISFIKKYGREPSKDERGKNWETKPPIPRYIGECFLKIANHLSFKPNFVNFNPEKSQNPFAYFTQIIHYAFLRRIQREKRQLEIKNKILERSGFSEVFEDNSIDGSNYSDYNSIKDNIHSKLRY
jgi:hypothetical protein